MIKLRSVKPSKKRKWSNPRGKDNDRPDHKSGSSRGSGNGYKASAGGSRGSGHGNRGDKGDREKRETDLKGESPSFLSMWHSGLFNEEAIRLVHASGLDTGMAVAVAGLKQPNRLSECFSAWTVVTKDKKVLSIVSDGYRLQFKSGPPITPYHGVNPPSTDKEKAVLAI